MKAILITGSPGAGKTSVSNELSEKFRENNIHHAIIDPDEIARIYPKHSLSDLKWDGLSRLYPLYEEGSVERIIIPVTIDNDSDLVQIQKIFGKENVTVISLIVDEDTLIKRVVAREPNEYWQNRLSELVRGYVRNDHSRTFDDIKIDGNNKTIDDIVTDIYKQVL